MAESRLLLARRVTFAALLVMVWAEVWLSLHDGAPWPIWLLRIGPLVMFLPGMLADRPRSYIWLCFVSLLYFMVDVLRVFATPQVFTVWLSLAAVVVLFCSATLYARWRAQQINAQQESIQDSSNAESQ